MIIKDPNSLWRHHYLGYFMASTGSTDEKGEAVAMTEHGGFMASHIFFLPVKNSHLRTF